MGCPKNPKKFLFIKYEGACEYKPTYIKAHATSGLFQVDYQCQKCGSEHESHFVKAQSLIRKGLDAEKLRSMSFFDTFGKSFEDLKEESQDVT